MIIAISLGIIGIFLGFYSSVFIVIPVGIIFTVSIFAYWVSVGIFDPMRLAVWIGYISALNAGFLLGTLFERRSRAGSSPTKKKMTAKHLRGNDLSADRAA